MKEATPYFGKVHAESEPVITSVFLDQNPNDDV